MSVEDRLVGCLSTLGDILGCSEPEASCSQLLFLSSAKDIDGLSVDGALPEEVDGVGEYPADELERALRLVDGIFPGVNGDSAASLSETGCGDDIRYGEVPKNECDLL